ncbi:LysR family transcriptional regulator [Phytohabitans houttuyneae]|uniref:LysR family transcriptional regulator n=1 Tax=Phytohabitans houttuyneae TaxID=1076126 RepID=UPI00156572A7|nr:LysR family transcriptional regulator [Phytohabitans houttuyneae]
MGGDLEIRMLRSFVVVAEELHFSRAAQRLFVAQQALSREIQRLEDRVGRPLFTRTTRQVALTAAGEELLGYARRLLALHDKALHALRGEPEPLLVDVVGPGLTPSLALAEARGLVRDVEFFARERQGLDGAVTTLSGRAERGGRIDVAFGRWTASGARAAGLRHRTVRLEPIMVLLPRAHPLAAQPAVPVAELEGSGVCFRAGDHVTQDWDEAMHQLLGPLGIDPALAHPPVHGADELAHHLHLRDAPILTLSTQPAVEGAVSRPLVRPVALYPWAMLWRADLDHPGLPALHAAVDKLSAAGGWLHRPDGAWLPDPEATRA